MRRVLVAVVLVVVLGACRVDALVRVKLKEDGSGLVTARIGLDADAVRAAEVDGGTLETRVRLDDLEAAGWRSTGWKRASDGGAVLTVRKAFDDPDEAEQLVAELNGPSGPVRDVRVTRKAGAFRSEWAFRAVADRRALDLAIADDPELVARLVAERVDVAALEAALTEQAGEALHLRVTAMLPNTSAEAVSVPAGKRVVLATRSSDLDVSRVVMLVVGIAIGVLAVFLLVVGERRGRGRRRVRSAQRP